MKFSPHLFVFTLLLTSSAFAQRSGSGAAQVQFTINTAQGTGRISPYVYGSNGHSDDRDERVAARRLGGNRLTGYNWENNASNAGSDYIHHSDNYLTRYIPPPLENNPGIVLTDFHDVSVETDTYTLLTLPAAGYVAKDKNGTVSEGETAPSSRWAEVRFTKGSPFLLTPDLIDNVVYVDESVHLLVSTYGDASTSTGVKGYAIDNEPALWPSTHPRIHPNKPTVQEVITRGIDMARGVKGVDPHAEIFGPAAYGFSEYQNLQDAPDWNNYTSYGDFLGAYLAKMKEAETQYGMRLLDVLDLHWYPEAQGEANNGEWVRVALSANSDNQVAYARMQAPRSLWDSSYTEHSWIGQWFSPIALLPRLHSTIDRHYPGTKIAFTEINYGGDNHISGGIAMADVLGIFGKYDVYMSNYWGAIESYVSSAYKIYRNYDGNGSAFGDIRARATTSNVEQAPIYASTTSDGRRTLHIIAINRSLSDPVDGRFTIAGGKSYRRGSIYAFDNSSAAIRKIGTIDPIASNEFTYTIPPLTVAHIVLEESGASGVEEEERIDDLRLTIAE